jgi:hypothetical protein
MKNGKTKNKENNLFKTKNDVKKIIIHTGVYDDQSKSLQKNIKRTVINRENYKMRNVKRVVINTGQY